MKSFIPLFVSLLTLTCYGQQTNDSINLLDGSISHLDLNETELTLDKKRLNLENKLDQSVISSFFKGYIISIDSGMLDDQTYFHFYSISLDQKEVLFFMMNEDSTVKLVRSSESISSFGDMFGIQIGMTYEEIRKIRGEGFSLTIGEGFETNMKFKDSNIFYVFYEPTGTTPGSEVAKSKVSPKAKVRYIYWFNSDEN